MTPTLAAIFVALTPQAPLVAERVEPRPNVLLVILDDFAATDLDAIETPGIDALAAQGLSFDRAYAMPVCSATRRSLWSGRYWNTHFGPPCGPTMAPPPEIDFALERPLPLRLREVGYDTALVGKWHSGVQVGALWPQAPRFAGFDFWRAGSLPSPRSCPGSGYEAWFRIEDFVAQGVDHSYLTATQAAEASLLLSERAKAGTPWLVVLSLNVPHEPFHTPPGVDLGPFPPTRAQYEAMVQDVDREISGILGAVDLSSTFVVLTADNGTPPGAERADQTPGRVKRTAYEDGIRVPLIVAGPGIPKGRTDALAHVADLHETIARWGGAEPDPRPDSMALQRVFQNPAAPHRAALYVGHLRAGQEWEAVVTPRWKLLRYFGELHELYDLELDPGEKEPLSLTENAKLVSMLAKLFPAE